MTFEALLSELEAKKYHAIYLLHGEEPYFIDRVSDFMEEHVLDEAEKSFNQTVVYGKDTDPQHLVDLAMQMPMMGARQLIMVKEAQHIRKWDAVEAYLKHPSQSTILVFCHKHKKFDRRKSIYKLFSKAGAVMASDRIAEYKVGDWVKRYLERKGYRIKPDALQLLVEYLGNDLSVITNELDKMLLNLSVAGDIGISEIASNIGVSKEYNVFELQNAMLRGQISRVNRIVHYMSDNPKSNPLVMINASLYSFFSKVYTAAHMPSASRSELAKVLRVNPYFANDYRQALKVFSREKLEEVFDILMEYDGRSKGIDNVSTPEGELLKEMIYRIMHRVAPSPVS